MPKRREERDQAREIWEKSGGKISIKELSGRLGVTEAVLRKWKSQDKWTAKKPRGAPKGNQNAKGRRNPKEKTGYGNKNAQTHGAYSKPDESSFTAADWAEIDQMAGQNELLRELTKKRIDLRKKIQALEEEPEEKRFVTGGIDGKSPITYWDSKIKYRDTLELEYNRVVGRTLKIYDQMQKEKSLEVQRQIAEMRLELQREKAMGIFEEDDDSEIPEE